VGAAYLLYIAVSLVISGERRGGGQQSAPRQSGWPLLRAAAFVNIVIAIVAASTAERLRHVSWFGRAARWLAASAMGALALRLAFAERR